MSSKQQNSPAESSVKLPGHPAFDWIRSEEISSLNVSVEEYRHKKTQSYSMKLQQV